MEIRLIKWLDSRQPTSSWQWLSDVDNIDPVECISVGILLKENENAVVLAQNTGNIEDSENAQVSGVVVIPKICITESEVIGNRSQEV